ncbi:hypothetical protein ACVWZ4_002504 [Bradyrhizobium sp. USDA 4472]
MLLECWLASGTWGTKELFDIDAQGRHDPSQYAD